jgi:glycosyltransferase involved in cell wall biosynthesis
LIDHVLCTSEFQRQALGPGYGALPWTITGNYIDPVDFPFTERRHEVFTIGRLSRHAPEKYPEDFPVFYELLNLPDTQFRVMAWSDELARKYRWHSFDERWDLLGAGYEPTLDFLHSLDLFVYPLGHTFRESWGRSTVEAMLTGAVPLVPQGHYFPSLIVHGETGFICGDFLEWQEHAQRLRSDHLCRQKIARQCHEHAVTKLCNTEEHRRVWMDMFRAVLAQ